MLHYNVDIDMTQGNGASKDTIRKVIRLEEANGFDNSATTCGLEEFIRRNLPQAAPVIAGYDGAGHFERQRLLARLREHLEGGDEEGLELSSPIARLKGVGKRRAEGLARLGIETIEDLLFYLPRRIEDRSSFRKIGELSPGEQAAVRGKIVALDKLNVGRGMTVVKAAIGDGTGFLYAVWFNQPWLAEQLRRGEEIDLYGKVELSHRELQIRSPIWEPAGKGLEIGRIVPIYPATEGITDSYLRSLIDRHLDRYLLAIGDHLPAWVHEGFDILPKREAIEGIHRPSDREAFERARRSLAFEELLLLQIGLLLTTRDEPGEAHAADGPLTEGFLAGLPFELTGAQERAIAEVESDLRRPIRMMRLLQGDVGSGKTIVALISALRAIDAGFQVAFMAPTEILAEQHFLNLSRLLAGLPLRVELLTASTKGKEELKRDVEGGRIDLLIGTHSLIQESVSFSRLGFAIVDEQHRFGVVQRSLLEEKGEKVDLLVMSATPIPRTIALTLYGEFDISMLDELPMGETRISTHWVASSRRDEVYAGVGKLLSEGKRGYVVLPLVEESEKVEASAAVQVAAELERRFPGIRVGLLHGRLAPAEKSDAMDRFRSGDIRLLVATTVIEVGIDVCDADFMVIEHAERFGLSQLHQLRGRIGRAGQKAVCYAIADAKTEEARRRLRAFVENSDGFVIAEEDLRIRGPGDLLGTQQHGFLSRLRAVDLLTDFELIRAAREAAHRIHREEAPEDLKEEVKRRFGEELKWLRV